nr:MAG TPA: hypothetical protein [Caudoviricetes sp.]
MYISLLGRFLSLLSNRGNVLFISFRTYFSLRRPLFMSVLGSF